MNDIVSNKSLFMLCLYDYLIEKEDVDIEEKLKIKILFIYLMEAFDFYHFLLQH